MIVESPGSPAYPEVPAGRRWWAGYQRLRQLHLVDPIPVSAAGTVLKRELRAQLT